MRKSVLIIWGIVMCAIATGYAQNFNSGKESSEFDKFVREISEDFENFRKNIMEEYAEFVKNPWKEFDETPPVVIPEEKPKPPVIKNDDEGKPVEDNPVVIEEVLPPPIKDIPRPQPVEPIEETPVVNPSYMTFEFFGTSDKVRLDREDLPSLRNLSENEVARTLRAFFTEKNDNLLFDCLSIREKRQLSDWAYLKMLEKVANEAYGGSSNEAQLFLAYLFMQSGYRMRLGTDGDHLFMLYASRHSIFNQPSFYVDGETYYGVVDLPGRLSICQAEYPKEQSLSLCINTSQKFDTNLSDKRTISSKAYNDAKIDVVVNKNLIDFYSTYPTSFYDSNIMTRWAMYANTPMDPNLSGTLYLALGKLFDGKPAIDAANILLNWIQTGLKYEYDDVVWGNDRAFFAEESVFYPYCDCEDRSILLTRIVRDVMGLECVLVYYPGHLAAAINFEDDSVKGDYILLDGKRYVIADPTYINAPVGYTMPDMDNNEAKVIRVE